MLMSFSNRTDWSDVFIPIDLITCSCFTLKHSQKQRRGRETLQTRCRVQGNHAFKKQKQKPTFTAEIFSSQKNGPDHDINFCPGIKKYPGIIVKVMAHPYWYTQKLSGSSRKFDYATQPYKAKVQYLQKHQSEKNSFLCLSFASCKHHIIFNY